MQTRSPTRVATELSSMLDHVAAGTAVTRARLAGATGLSRSTVASRVETLLGHGLLTEQIADHAAVGRPPQMLSMHDDAGVLLCGEGGAHRTTVAVCGLHGNVLACRSPDAGGSRRPGALEQVTEVFDELLAEMGRTPSDVLGVGVTIASPVDVDAAEVLRPPYSSHWSASELRDHFTGRFGRRVVIENDANAMAVGEVAARGLDAADLVFVKIGTGIGCGSVIGGRLHRGSSWAAGDIGHARLPGRDDIQCRCGATGCLEAVAAGWALLKQVRAEGLAIDSTEDLVHAARSGDGRALRAVRGAGRYIGEVVASLISYVNPSHLVVGGELAHLEDDLLAEIRGIVYQQAVPLATHALRIERSIDGDLVGLRGIGLLLRREILSPTGIRELLGV